MRRLLPILVASFMIVISTFGCASWRANKAALNKNGPDQISAAPNKDSGQAKPGSGAESEQPKAGGPDPNERADVNRAALEFAAAQGKVKHLKTCYSQITREWYMLMFMEEGKNISMVNYSWDPKDKEWKTTMRTPKYSPEMMEFELKGDVPGENCTTLK
jgi:hypothetical protein